MLELNQSPNKLFLYSPLPFTLWWYTECSDRAELETVCGNGVPHSVGICYRQCLWLQTVPTEGRSEAAGKGEHQLTQRHAGSPESRWWKQSLESSTALQGILWQEGKFVDKPLHFYAAFPCCSEFPHFIYPVWYSFKTGFFLCFKAFQSSLASCL